MAIYPIEIASHSFAMTSINSSRLNATWNKIPSIKFSALHSNSFFSFLSLFNNVSMVNIDLDYF